MYCCTIMNDTDRIKRTDTKLFKEVNIRSLWLCSHFAAIKQLNSFKINNLLHFIMTWGCQEAIVKNLY